MICTEINKSCKLERGRRNDVISSSFLVKIKEQSMLHESDSEWLNFKLYRTRWYSIPKHQRCHTKSIYNQFDIVVQQQLCQTHQIWSRPTSGENVSQKSRRYSILIYLFIAWNKSEFTINRFPNNLDFDIQDHEDHWSMFFFRWRWTITFCLWTERHLLKALFSSESGAFCE